MFIFGKPSKLKPTLGFWELLLMAVSGTLGGGFFVLLGQGAQKAGYLLPLSFLVAGFVAFLVSRIYAELATSMPATGGGQVYVRNAFGTHPILFIVHWLTWIAELAFTSLAALGLGFYLAPLLHVNSLLITLIVIGVLVFINLVGVEKVGQVEQIIGLILLLTIVGLIILALQGFSWSSLQWAETNASFLKNNLGWLTGIPLIFVVFLGNEDLVAIASEIKNKARNIPRVLGLSVLGITALTVLLSFVLVQTFPLEQLANSPRPFTLFAQKFGSLGSILAYATVLLACASSAFYGFLADTRTAFALSEAGELPKVFSIISDKNVPQGSIIISGIIITFLCLSESASLVAYIANVGFFLECIILSVALITLRKKRPHLPRPFLARPYPLVPLFVIVISVVFLLLSPARAWLAVGGFSLLGFLVYLLKYFNKKRALYALLGIGIFIFIVAVLSLLLIIL